MGGPLTKRNSPYSKRDQYFHRTTDPPDNWESVRDRKGYGITTNRRRRSDVMPKKIASVNGGLSLLTKPVIPYFSGLSMRHCRVFAAAN
jgi:hypothetical protein